MKVLVTGATGFIGAVLVKALLKEGHAVSVISRRDCDFDPQVTVYQMDLLESDFGALGLASFDVIFNCAGELKVSSRMKSLHIDVPLKMLSFLRGSSCRWVQLSSVGVYGKQMDGEVDETTPFNPSGDYEVTKADAEHQIVSYCRANDISYSILRPSNVFGEHMPNNWMRSLVKTIVNDRFFYMASPSEVQMNFVHIDNVVAALLLCGFHSRAIGQAFNISDHLSQNVFVECICLGLDKPIPNKNVPAIIVKIGVHLLGWLPKFPFGIGAINALTTRAVYSTLKIEKELGFRKIKPLYFALDEFVKSYK
ncbi:NAD-dependent epimerase/dehydratase family protein [Neptuniibacter pectenicola]|uniref:NAD-dependent epimerase/dehydratase family protein n=1 Tax=Neptuniibacter pectenicola TaxID=1806669 RepID=A0ABU9TM57_9GAMM